MSRNAFDETSALMKIVARPMGVAPATPGLLRTGEERSQSPVTISSASGVRFQVLAQDGVHGGSTLQGAHPRPLEDVWIHGDREVCHGISVTRDPC